MKPQETAQERAEKWIKDTFGVEVVVHPAHKALIDGHIEGQLSGERIALERLAVKAGEGFRDFANSELFKGQLMTSHETSWQFGRAPLLAKIELQDQRIKTLESALVDMAKALEYMDNLPRGATTDRGYKALSKHQELLSEIQKDGE